MERPTVETICEAYKETGLLPEKYHLAVRNNSCCPLGALYVNATRIKPMGEKETDIAYKWSEENFGKDFVCGLRRGFDNIVRCDEDGDYRIGFELGQKAAVALGVQ